MRILMPKQPEKTYKCLNLQANFIKKTEKEKFGGNGVGGVYRHKKSGKDYLVKRVATTSVMSIEQLKYQQKDGRFRVWDEVLVANILRQAGVLAPKMFAVEDDTGWLYVASEMLPAVKDCTSEVFHNLPKSSKQAVYASLILHAWLGNRDIVNAKGENFVVDSSNRVFAVDLGVVLFSGFRRLVSGQDKVNFTAENISQFMLESRNDNFAIFCNTLNRGGKTETALNKEMIEKFFAEFLANPDDQRTFQLQGALMLAQFSDQDIEKLVNATDHHPEDKALRIDVLKSRKATILNYLKKKYGEHALEEEQISLALQRIFHRQGILNVFVNGAGQDAVVSFKSQFHNAVKPQVTITPNYVSIKADKIEAIRTALGLFINPALIEKVGSQLQIKVKPQEFKSALHAMIIENTLQVFFASFGYHENLAGPFHHFVYKGDGHHGFRPRIKAENDTIVMNVPINANPGQIKQKIVETFDLEPDSITIENGQLLFKTDLEVLATRFMANTGVRKTAVVSENKEGKILAGKLSKQKKGVSGFATAGGNSEHPYNPLRAAREEGTEEFGHTVNIDSGIIPLGSTLTNKKKNIFLIPPGGTSEQPDAQIPYMEFENGTIRYYDFREFREAYIKEKIRFDRSSVDLYLRHYQRMIQKLLPQLGIDNILVHISKEPQTLGKIFLKPCTDHYVLNGRNVLKVNSQLTELMTEVVGKENYRVINKKSTQGKKNGAEINILRECIELNDAMNPAQFHQLLAQKITANPVVNNLPVMHQPLRSPVDEVRKTLIQQIDSYLKWRANKSNDDLRGYPLGLFTRIRHYTQFGFLRAEDLKKQLEKVNSMDELTSLLCEHLQKDSRLNNHSLDTYLLEGIEKYKELFAIQQNINLRKMEDREMLRDFLTQCHIRIDFPH